MTNTNHKKDVIAAWNKRVSPSEIPVIEAGDTLPAGMVKISKLIADLQSTMDRFGDTCVYIRPGVSWGAVALNRRGDDEKAIEETAASFSEQFKPEHKELARQIMECAISMGWARPPMRESGSEEIPRSVKVEATKRGIHFDDMEAIVLAYRNAT